ncbi:Protoporphyrinogen oxidase [Chlamydiales bacterium STE3]|nr:Protoporphyrinogen oxidase [Chlamydiales bacterium STE3]
MSSLMSMSKPRVKVAILGGGISGLATAYFLKKKWGNALDLKLFEAKNRLGGWIDTIEKEGFLFELGPHSMRMNEGDELCSLITDLGLAEELLQANANVTSRYLFLDGQMRKLPHSLFPLFWHPYTRKLLPSILKEPFIKALDCDDESIASFFKRRFSSELVDHFVDPMIKGIFGGDPNLLSMQSCFPSLHKMEKRYGSLIRGFLAQSFKGKKKERVVTLKCGLKNLVEALGKALEGNILLATPIVKMECNAKKTTLYWEQHSSSFDVVISALPSYLLAKLMAEEKLAKMLASIPYASFAVVNFGFRQQEMPLKGFGYLVPSKEKQDILGTIFDSEIFPEQNRAAGEARLTVMMGGWQKPELLKKSEEELINIALQNLSSHLRLQLNPEIKHVAKLHQAIPQYFVGHESTLRQIHHEVESLPIYLAGNAFSGVSLKDCVIRAKHLAETLAIEREPNG